MKIQKCGGCGGYTLKTECPTCGGKTSPVGPAKYSPQDAYGKYRRLMKEQMNDG